ncbi:hypothetical protein FHW69_000544 [Luteibacter sp. Sphag1AF]|uniref:hypothetical protein n=1 Tax=Luteibacter sp. Sphag1AF TaxID=2587031 RepID=UPI00160A5E38|nr:hypothetical protein [Luteibacter sp. Sphag1AF]MBB3225954.1 hypothetical protein [Luteibacter sp. Sphag1AF]
MKTFPVMRLTMLALVMLIAACGFRQRVYMPQDWIEGADGSYALGGEDWRITMPVMVVAKSDITLHPAITLSPGKHTVSITRARWVLHGQSIAPKDADYEGKPITGPTLLNLNWEFPKGTKAVDELGADSIIRLDMVVDGEPRSVDVPMVLKK